MKKNLLLYAIIYYQATATILVLTGKTCVLVLLAYICMYIASA